MTIDEWNEKYKTYILYHRLQQYNKMLYKEVEDKPKTFDEYIGQKKIIDFLRIITDNCKKQNRPLDHILLYGREGLGKTSLAYILSKEMNSNLLVANAGDFDIKKIYNYVEFLRVNDLWLIDEIHRLTPSVEEVLYTIMEDFRLNEKTINKFTLIGCTTLPSMLNKPLLNRFIIQLKLDFYKLEDIEKIIENYAKILKIRITDEAKRDIAIRSRNVPRIAVSYLKQCRNLVENEITINDTQILFNFLEIDEFGVNKIGRDILQKLYNSPKPMGSKILAISLGLNESIIQDEEEYLLRIGLIQVSSRGRELTQEGKNYVEGII